MKISWKIWLLIAVLVGSSVLISPNFFQKGVIIKSVEKNSTAYEQGLRTNMIITAVNGKPVNNFQDYSNIMSSGFISGTKVKLIITAEETEVILFTDKAPSITVTDISPSRIKTGLDLSGGARALVKAENKTLSSNELNDLVSITSNRFNEFGIADITIKPVRDLSGNNFMQVEVAGATPSDLDSLISQQGKFEAKIGNDTVFVGGNKDITYVARTGEQSGIYSCQTYQQSQEVCSFRFTISLSEEAAKRHSKITNKLGINSSNPEYLDKKLDLFLDGKLTDSLFIGKDLKGSETTQISISGSGTGKDRQEAYNEAVNNMKKLQTILITGSLPYKLEIVKLDTISPSLGKEFTKNIILLALIAFIAVSIILFIKYRKIKITLSVILTMFSEAFITLAIAVLINWNLDAPSIAGIIAGMGTGLNDQIVILDEAVSDKKSSLKERIKNAFFVILSVFALVIVAMVPLFWAGAGLLKGFALTTIIGVCVGILITRPAFSEIVKLIVKE